MGLQCFISNGIQLVGWIGKAAACSWASCPSMHASDTDHVFSPWRHTNPTLNWPSSGSRHGHGAREACSSNRQWGTSFRKKVMVALLCSGLGNTWHKRISRLNRSINATDQFRTIPFPNSLAKRLWLVYCIYNVTSFEGYFDKGESFPFAFVCRPHLQTQRCNAAWSL